MSLYGKFTGDDSLRVAQGRLSQAQWCVNRYLPYVSAFLLDACGTVFVGSTGEVHRWRSG